VSAAPLLGAAEQRKREGDAQRLGSIEVDDQLDFHRLVNRQVQSVWHL
jgi:hypothetical protein